MIRRSGRHRERSSVNAIASAVPQKHLERQKVAYLRSLPWIGDITCWHLAKNYGHDVAKPDRHLVRIAGDEGVHGLCARLARESGDRVATVDLVIWRAANLGMI